MVERSVAHRGRRENDMSCKHLRLWTASAIIAVLAFAASPPASAEEALVKIVNFAFVPPNLAVKAGTTVTFRNDDDEPHLVVAGDGSFKSKALDTKDTFAYTFSQPGEFSYFCSLHPHMQGKISVSR
jgi:plastocyanin